MALITPKSLEDWKAIQIDKFLELVPNINTNSDSMVSIDAAVIAEVAYMLQQDIITLTNNAFIAYATGDELSNLGADRGIPRKEATASIGEVTFSRQEKASANYSILEGTTVSTEEDSSGSILTFKTTESVVLYGTIENPTGLSGSVSSNGNVGDGNYIYTVSAIAGDGKETGHSEEVEIEVVGTGNSISLSWDTVARASSYNIYLGGLLLGNTENNSYNDTVGSTSSTVQHNSENNTGNTSITVGIESTGTGNVYNTGIASIVKLIENPVGIESVINNIPTSLGSDTETDDIYRERIKSSLNSNSGKTTASGYENTALSVSGVASATAVHEEGKELNEITVFITSSDEENPTATQELLDRVTAELNHDDNRAVCDVLTAKAAVVIPINVEVNISEYDEETYTEADITSALTERLTDFMRTIPTEGTLRIVSVGNIIHDTPGVVDYNLVTPIENYNVGPTETVSLGVLTVNY